MSQIRGHLEPTPNDCFVTVSDPGANTCSLMYFSIPESFLPSRLASETLFFREGVLRHDLSEHWKERGACDEGSCALSKPSGLLPPKFSKQPSSNGRDDLRPFGGATLFENNRCS